MIDLGSLSKEHTYVKATAINNKGEIVGWSGIGEGWNSTTRPFLWDKANGMRDLTKLVGGACPFLPRTAYDIDDNGDILVYGYRKQFWNGVQALAILRKSPQS
jgi:probable HAF family extracellular repeat protein